MWDFLKGYDWLIYPTAMTLFVLTMVWWDARGDRIDDGVDEPHQSDDE